MQLCNKTISSEPEEKGRWKLIITYTLKKKKTLYLRYKEHFGSFAPKIPSIEVFDETNPRYNEKISPVPGSLVSSSSSFDCRPPCQDGYCMTANSFSYQKMGEPSISWHCVGMDGGLHNVWGHGRWNLLWRRADLFAITRFRFVKVVSQKFYYYWGKDNRMLYRGLLYIEVRYIEVPL